MINRLKAILAVIVIALMATTAPARAQGPNLLLNSDFNTNANWTMNQNGCSSPVGNPFQPNGYFGSYADGGNAYNGVSDLWIGGVGCTPSASQAFTDIIGDPYQFTVWARQSPDYAPTANNFFQLSVDGHVLYGSDITNTAWQAFTVSFYGTGNDYVDIGGWNADGGLTAGGATVKDVAPEPMTMSLMAMGLVGLTGAGGLQRRRRKLAA